MRVSSIKLLGKRFVRDKKEFSFAVAFGRLLRDTPLIPWNIRRKIYEKSIIRYLEDHYLKYIINECNKITDVDVSKCDVKTVWTMWWQGIENMPPIVLACYNHLKKQCQDMRVVLITENNWNEYITIPEIIIEKFQSGLLSITHFSDIIRVNLLKKWGGYWVDATMYIADLPNEINEFDFFTLHAPNLFPNFISRGEWSPFFLGGNRNMCLMKNLCLLFYEYWKEHTELIDYLLIDYFIKIIKNHNTEISSQIEKCPLNYNYYDLNISINEEFDKVKFNDMITKSPVQKLTYKKDFNEYTADGKLTNYGYLIK